MGRVGGKRPDLAERNRARASHGHTRDATPSPTYVSWNSARDRCREGGPYFDRGIRVCARWDSFDAFLADMGPKPRGASLERIDNDGHYEPSNCRWASRTEQARNRRSNVMVTHAGRTLCIAAWAEVVDLPRWTLERRIRNGWSAEDALTRPLRGCRRSHVRAQ